MSDYETIIEELQEERIRFGDKLKRIQELLLWAMRNQHAVQQNQNNRSEIGNLPHQWFKLLDAEGAAYVRILCRQHRVTPLQILQIAHFAKTNHNPN